MNARPAGRALDLVDSIYAAALDPPRWSEFLARLSHDLGDTAIAMSLLLPGWELPAEYYRIHLSPEYVPAFERHFRSGGLPWPMTDPVFRGGFAWGREVFPDAEIPSTGFWADYMEPQGLAPEGPLAHLIVSAEGRPVSGISIQRRVGGRALDEDDVETCDRLVPHLATAMAIRNEQIRSVQEREARTEILDRMPIGVLILDDARRSVVKNRLARQILEQDDGLFERDGVLHAARPADEQRLQSLIRSSIGFDPGDPLGGGPFEGRFQAVRRPSGKPDYALFMTRLFGSQKPSSVGDEVAAILISNPAPERPAHVDTFRQLFGLTGAEAEVVGLLTAGYSLDEISQRRGVKLTTTRTLLRRVFAKTRTRRQGEIVRLVLGSGAPIDAPRDAD
ncbi:MAG: hypothetical protein ACQGVC_19785 [Myxococcota bacterium]